MLSDIDGTVERVRRELDEAADITSRQVTVSSRLEDDSSIDQQIESLVASNQSMRPNESVDNFYLLNKILASDMIVDCDKLMVEQ